MKKYKNLNKGNIDSINNSKINNNGNIKINNLKPLLKIELEIMMILKSDVVN
jgi:hypothetical protein